MKAAAARAPRSWPAEDQALWQTLITPAAHPFDDEGALSHLRPATLDSYATFYSLWLAWLGVAVPEAVQEAPECRATFERLHAWTDSMAGNAPMSRAFRLKAVLRVVSAAAPDADWSLQRRLLRRLERQASRDYGSRKQGRILSSEVLLQAGLDLAGPHADAASTPLRTMIHRRDGLMIAFLALLPLRVETFSTLEFERSVLRIGGRWVIRVDGIRMKGGRPWEAPLPSVLAESFDRYVNEVRPKLISRASAPHAWLWVGDHGEPYTKNAITGRIRKVTRARIGVCVPPQFFRDAAATTLARWSPEAARLIRPLLAHTNFRTAQQHYIQAQGIEAGRVYAAIIDRRKHDLSSSSLPIRTQGRTLG